MKRTIKKFLAITLVVVIAITTMTVFAIPVSAASTSGLTDVTSQFKDQTYYFYFFATGKYTSADLSPYCSNFFS